MHSVHLFKIPGHRCRLVPLVCGCTGWLGVWCYEPHRQRRTTDLNDDALWTIWGINILPMSATNTNSDPDKEATGAAALERGLGSAVEVLLHDLQVHQIELHMQNEELRRAKDALDASRARYVDLYDLAPVGYCSVCEKGSVLQANLTLATLLGVTRSALDVNTSFTNFVFRHDQDIWYRLRATLLAYGTPQNAELRMRYGGGVGVKGGEHPFVWVDLSATVAYDGPEGRVLHIAVSDISERKRQEQERLALAQQVDALSRDNERAAERGRILRDMHDGVGSHISSAIRQLKVELERRESPACCEVLQTLHDALDQLKLSIDSIHLAPGDVAGLLANMRYRLEPRFTAMGLELHWDVEALPFCRGLDASAMNQLQYMLLEGLSNVLQHAKARILRIEGHGSASAELPFANGEGRKCSRVFVRVVDDGCGFDPSLDRRSGLAIMGERALAIGAQLRITSTPGKTVLEIEIKV